NWGDQLVKVWVDDPLRDPYYFLTNDYWSTTNLPWLIEHAADCGTNHRGCRPALRMWQSEWLHSALFILGLGLFGLVAVRRDVRELFRRRLPQWDEPGVRLLVILALVLAAVV